MQQSNKGGRWWQLCSPCHARCPNLAFPLRKVIAAYVLLFQIPEYLPVSNKPVRKGHGRAARHCRHPRPPAETEVFGQEDERKDLAWRSGEGVNKSSVRTQFGCRLRAGWQQRSLESLLLAGALPCKVTVSQLCWSSCSGSVLKAGWKSCQAWKINSIAVEFLTSREESLQNTPRKEEWKEPVKRRELGQVKPLFSVILLSRIAL